MAREREASANRRIRVEGIEGDGGGLDRIGFAGGFGNGSFPRAKEKEEAEGKRYFINVGPTLLPIQTFAHCGDVFRLLIFTMAPTLWTVWFFNTAFALIE